MEDKLTLAKILQSDLEDFLIPDGKKVLMNQVSGDLRRHLMKTKQSICLEAKPSPGTEMHELFGNLEVFINSYNIVSLTLANELTGTGVFFLSEYLPRCPFLAVLNLKSNDIGDKGVEMLAAVLPKCASLAHLNLSFNNIGPKGMEMLTAVLGQCASHDLQNHTNKEI